MNGKNQAKDWTDWTRDKLEIKNMVLIIWITWLLIFLWIIISWFTWTGPQSLKCDKEQSFFDWKCYDNQIKCIVENWYWIKKWEWNNYSECIIKNCNEWYEILENSCVSKIRERKIVLNNEFIVKDYEIWAYPKIKINDEIYWWFIKYTVDYSDEYKKWPYSKWYIYGIRPDWTTARSVFAFYFFLWENIYAKKSPYLEWFWWFFNVFAQRKSWDFRNDASKWLFWLIEWKYILWWYTREIPISNEVFVATKSEEWKEWYQYKPLRLKEYINKHIWSYLHIWWFLSNWWIEWWKFTNIKSIEIEYIWNSWAIEIMN